MFCPNCGNNQANDKKFCTTCGTNLAVVSSALSSQTGGLSTNANLELVEAEARYKRQLAAAMQRGAPGVALLAAALLVFFFAPVPAWFWICFGLTIGGITTLGKGIALNFLARSEWHAAIARIQASQSQTAFPTSSSTPLFSSTPTNPHLTPPHSVTEDPTRHL
ncbi:MAG TPA: hypothetical protein VEF04_19455 [Blastocatellia bacterium]|nr:hypothetical protein [Blastocatellia bacterium]